jgi:hypothetical protein
VSKAFVDTTILTDAVLKRDEYYKAARAALKRFAVTQLPVYAIKEFKAGPLKNFVWIHNKLALLKSYHKALAVLQRMSLSPRKYTTATAIQALAEAAKNTSYLTTKELVEKYGQKATLDSINCDRFRLALKQRISRAWKERRIIATTAVNPLPCYTELDPYEENGLLVLDPLTCEGACCLGPAMSAKRQDLERLREALPKTPTRREDQRRSQALRELIRKPKQPISKETCTNLGDAVFAFFAPQDSIILTTNLRDHLPLAQALGKQVQKP